MKPWRFWPDSFGANPSGSAAGRYVSTFNRDRAASWLLGLRAALRALSGDEAISRRTDALRHAANQVDDPEEGSRLRRLADNAGSVSRDVLAAVLATVITGGIAT